MKQLIAVAVALFIPASLHSQSCSEMPAPNSVSRLYRVGSKLCWNGKPVKLIGYGTTDLATRDGYDYARFLNMVRFVPDSDPDKRHGVNMTRIWATGTSNSPDCYHTPAEHDPSQPPMTMPFHFLNGQSCNAQNVFPKYDMCISNVACKEGVGLNQNYVSRLQNILDEARRNGIIVDLVLFDGYFMGKRKDQDYTPLYARNPWNPLHNNMNSKKFRNSPGTNNFSSCNNLYRSKSVDDTSGFPFPEFYDICRDSRSTPRCNATLNCLGLIQKAYVQSIVDLVKKNDGGSDHVFFEIMNRIRFDRNDPSFNFEKLKRWHDVVGYWIKCRSDRNCKSAKGDYLVAAVVGVAEYSDVICENPSDCPANPLDVFSMPNIDILNVPAHTWNNTPGAVGPCETAELVVKKYKKPVIIDTDGTPEFRADKCEVEKWATEVTSCSSNRGQVHFDHLDGMTLDERIAKSCNFTARGRPVNEDFDERYLDCHTLDTMGDAGPTFLSDIVTAPASPYCLDSVGSDHQPKWCSDSCEAK